MSGAGCQGNFLECVVPISAAMKTITIALSKMGNNYYGPWSQSGCGYAHCSERILDTCNSDMTNAYVCQSGEVRTCTDIADYIDLTDDEVIEWNSRTVSCGGQ